MLLFGLNRPFLGQWGVEGNPGIWLHKPMLSFVFNGGCDFGSNDMQLMQLHFQAVL
jgi:hypothetical protein